MPTLAEINGKRPKKDKKTSSSPVMRPKSPGGLNWERICKKDHEKLLDESIKGLTAAIDAWFRAQPKELQDDISLLFVDMLSLSGKGYAIRMWGE